MKKPSKKQILKAFDDTIEDFRNIELTRLEMLCVLNPSACKFCYIFRESGSLGLHCDECVLGNGAKAYGCIYTPIGRKLHNIKTKFFDMDFVSFKQKYKVQFRETINQAIDYLEKLRKEYE
jgi:hypothetical protein